MHRDDCEARDDREEPVGYFASFVPLATVAMNS